MPIDIDNDDLTTALRILKAREESFQQYEALSNLGSWEVDLQTGQSIWSDQSYVIYGEDQDVELNLELFFSHVVPEDLARAQLTLKKAMTHNEVTTFQCKIKRKDGAIRDILINGQVIFDEEKRPSKLIGTTQDITDQIQLKKYSDQLSELIEKSVNEIYIVEYETLDYLYVNDGACKALGYTKDELLLMNVRDVNPYLSDEHIQGLRAEFEEGHQILNRSIHKRKDGSEYHVQAFIHSLHYNSRNAFVIFDTDISESIDLQEKHEQQSYILDNIHDSIISVSQDGFITSWNRGSKRIFGFSENDVLGRDISELFRSHNEHLVETFLDILEEQEEYTTEIEFIAQNDKVVICDCSITKLIDSSNGRLTLIFYSQDITKQKEAQLLLQEQEIKLNIELYHDKLTKLPNRTLFKDRLSQNTLHGERSAEGFALMIIDLDHFKKINDSLGHDAGDEIITTIAKRIHNCIDHNDLLARLGGDEFAIILNSAKTVREIAQTSRKIIAATKEQIELDGQPLFISASIGISLYPQDTTDENDLMKFADTAMYKAKDNGRDTFAFFSSDMSTQAFEKVVLENSLRVALKEDQFIVFFQPQFNGRSKQIIGMEALVRWQHPQLGLVPPNKFIPIAEESNLILEMDELVMQKAMIQFVEWYDQGYNPGILALNMSVKQLTQMRFADKLQQKMQELNFKPEWLELEITEGQVMEDPESSIEILKQLHALGIELAIDDFGTGYSSLAYLKKLPLDKLKIDRSFVMDIPQDEDDVAITKAIIALAKTLKLNLIAEGVETVEQNEFLLQEGCENIQGYLFARPMPAKDVEILLNESK